MAAHFIGDSDADLPPDLLDVEAQWWQSQQPTLSVRNKDIGPSRQLDMILQRLEKMERQQAKTNWLNLLILAMVFVTAVCYLPSAGSLWAAGASKVPGSSGTSFCPCDINTMSAPFAERLSVGSFMKESELSAGSSSAAAAVRAIEVPLQAAAAAPTTTVTSFYPCDFNNMSAPFAERLSVGSFSAGSSSAAAVRATEVPPHAVPITRAWSRETPCQAMRMAAATNKTSSGVDERPSAGSSSAGNKEVRLAAAGNGTIAAVEVHGSLAETQAARVEVGLTSLTSAWKATEPSIASLLGNGASLKGQTAQISARWPVGGQVLCGPVSSSAISPPPGPSTLNSVGPPSGSSRHEEGPHLRSTLAIPLSSALVPSVLHLGWSLSDPQQTVGGMRSSMHKDMAVTGLLQAAQATAFDFWAAGRTGLLRCLSTLQAAGAKLLHTAGRTLESLKSLATSVSAHAAVARDRMVSDLNAKLEIVKEDWRKLQALCSMARSRMVSILNAKLEIVKEDWRKLKALCSRASAAAAALRPTSDTFLEGLVLDAADEHAFDHITSSQWSLRIDFQILWVLAAYSLVGASMPHLTL